MKILLFADIGTNETGFFHVGDEAMFTQTAKWYREKFPQIKLGALSRSISHKSLLKHEHIHLTYPVDPMIATPYFAKLIIKTFVYFKLHINKFSRSEFDFVKLITQYDALHFTGGGNIYSICKSWLYYAFFLIYLFAIQNKRIVMTSQTIGPLWGIDKVLAKYFLNLPQLIVLREDITNQEPLQEYGINKPTIAGMLDVAYTQSIFDSKQLPKKRFIRIGLSLHSLYKYESTVLDLVADHILSLAKTKSIELVLIPHILVHEEIQEWGMWYMKQLKDKLPRSIKIIAPGYNTILNSKIGPIEMTRRLTATTDLMIVTRYHGLIFSLSSNTPVIVLSAGEYYNRKNSNALKLVYRHDYTKYIVNLASRDYKSKFAAQFKYMTQNFSSERKKLVEKNVALLANNQLFTLDQLPKWVEGV